MDQAGGRGRARVSCWRAGEGKTQKLSAKVDVWAGGGGEEREMKKGGVAGRANTMDVSCRGGRKG